MRLFDSLFWATVHKCTNRTEDEKGKGKKEGGRKGKEGKKASGWEGGREGGREGRRRTGISFFEGTARGLCSCRRASRAITSWRQSRRRGL